MAERRVDDGHRANSIQDMFAREKMQTQGYMIALKPDAVLERYLRVGDSPARADYLRQLRLAFIGVDPKRYRGISREPLSAYANLDQKTIEWYQTMGGELSRNGQARYRFRQLIGDLDENYEAGVDEELLASQSDAQQVLDLVEDPDRWEVIHLLRGSQASSLSTLGYDIGYWGGDHFSLIADTIIIPRWHPAPPKEFGELKEALSQLNANLLFNSAQEAGQYRAYYRSKPWAETADQEDTFCIIKVDAVSIGLHADQ